MILIGAGVIGVELVSLSPSDQFWVECQKAFAFAWVSHFLPHCETEQKTVEGNAGFDKQSDSFSLRSDYEKMRNHNEY